jgi:hypothetical protein
MLNEAEVREKILDPWLRDMGFKNSDIILESTFSIQLGRNKQIISGRSDYLVKSNMGTNLFIIEAKSQSVTLCEEDKNQAISYARLISNGNIPPFVLVTNGLETIIYDTITKAKVNGSIIEHPHVQNRFQIDCSISDRGEALTYLLALNEQSLHQFCVHQVSHRIKPLKGDDIFCGKKYIPILHTGRKEAENKLNELLFKDAKQQKLVLVTGSPQKGKTSFICNRVEYFLEEKKLNCLFYPAVGCHLGLLDAIKEDFHWVFFDQTEIVHIVHQLDKILKVKNEKLYLFIDGLNEVDQNLALTIVDECQRISSDKIIIILSATSNSLGRLLFRHGNPNFLAEQTNINLKEVEILSKKALQNITEKAIIQLNDFTENELKDAFEAYKNIYKVQCSGINELFVNPFLLRVSMELYSGQSMPDNLNDARLMEESLFLKASRAAMSKTFFQTCILELTEILYKNDSPIVMLHKLAVQDSDLQRLYEAAVLAELHTENNRPAIDFYYSRERDYCIAYLLNDWPSLFLNKEKETIKQNFCEAISTTVGIEALRWFFSSPTHIKQTIHCYDLLESDGNAKVKDILFHGILNQNFISQEDLNWLSLKAYAFKSERLVNNSQEAIEETSIFFYQLIKGSGIKRSKLTNNQIVLLKELMLLEFQLYEDNPDYDIYDNIKESYSISLLEDFNLISDFEELMLDKNDKVSQFAALLWVESYNDICEIINKWLQINDKRFILKHKNFIPALECVVRNMAPDMCDPHQMYDDRDEQCISGYIESRDLFKGILTVYSDYTISNFFREEINYLKEYALEALQKNPQLKLEDWVMKEAPELLNLEIPTNQVPNPFQLGLDLD